MYDDGIRTVNWINLVAGHGGGQEPIQGEAQTRLEAQEEKGEVEVVV